MFFLDIVFDHQLNPNMTRTPQTVGTPGSTSIARPQRRLLAARSYVLADIRRSVHSVHQCHGESEYIVQEAFATTYRHC